MEFCVLEFLLKLKYDLYIVNPLESKPAKKCQKVRVSPAYNKVFTVSDWTHSPKLSLAAILIFKFFCGFTFKLVYYLEVIL